MTKAASSRIGLSFGLDALRRQVSFTTKTVAGFALLNEETTMKTTTLAVMLGLMSAPVFADGHAEGDAAEGEAQFNRQCVACHVVRNADGEVLAGRNAKTGPNLYDIAGRTIGSVDGFRYGDGIVKVGEAGGIWTEDNFVGYVQDPTDWLREKLDDRRARGKMAYKVREEDQAKDIYAYLATFTDTDALMMKLEEGAENEMNQ